MVSLSSRSASRRREELERRERIVSLVEELEREGGDPFSVDVRGTLEELREGYDSEDREVLLADSRAIEALSRLVKMQEEWIDGRLSASISPEAVKRRAMEADLRDLARALYESQSPAVGVSSIRAEDVLAGAEYWRSLRPKERAEPPKPRRVEVEVELRSEGFEEELGAFRARVEEALGRGGRVPLGELLSKEMEKRVRELYLLAHLAAMGVAEAAYDPEADEYIVRRPSGELRSVVLEA